jgi:predicted kinase
MGIVAELPVLILTGPPGSGKTTVARALTSRYERAVHLESDRFFDFIRSGYVEPWRPESHGQNSVVMGIVAQAAGGYARAGYFTIVDGIVLPRWFLEPLRDSFESQGHAVSYAVLRASAATCISRTADRPGRQLADQAVVEQLWWDFSDLESLEDHVVDNDDSTPERTAQVIAGELHGRLALSPDRRSPV